MRSRYGLSPLPRDERDGPRTLGRRFINAWAGMVTRRYRYAAVRMVYVSLCVCVCVYTGRADRVCKIHLPVIGCAARRDGILCTEEFGKQSGNKDTKLRTCCGGKGSENCD